MINLDLLALRTFYALYSIRLLRFYSSPLSFLNIPCALSLSVSLSLNHTDTGTQTRRTDAERGDLRAIPKQENVIVAR